MGYSIDIPGQVSEEELKFIEKLASAVPTNGKIVELGSLFGRSSYAWSKSVDSNATVYCIDPWKRENWIAELEDRFNTEFGIEAFHRNTATCKNIVALPGYSPNDFTDWNIPIDLYFDDSVHTNPVFRQNLDFWINHVKPGGVMCGHDYNSEFPDVVNEVNDLARRVGTQIQVVGALWSIRLPDTYVADSASNNSRAGIAPLPRTLFPIEEAPKLQSHISSMMKQEELDLLYNLAKTHYRGIGEIIDLGPFLGSSTIMLADGLQANQSLAHKSRRIYSFDQFIYEEYRGFDSFLNKADLPTMSFFENYLFNIGTRAKNIYLSPGDLLKFKWNGNPVEVLFIDLSKSPELNNHIISQFFGALIENQSVVVQQDYFFFACPWIAISMEFYSEWLQHVGSARGATAYFFLKNKIPNIFLRTPIDVANNTERQMMLLDRAIARQGASNRRAILEFAKAYHLHVHGNSEDAIETVLGANIVDDDWSDDARWNRDAALLQIRNC